ncbi:MAG: hypothetical protein AAGI38_07245 [Bacteroidota bacterium]
MLTDSTSSAYLTFSVLNLIGGGLCVIFMIGCIGEILNGRRLYIPVWLLRWELYLRFTQFLVWRRWREFIAEFPGLGREFRTYQGWFHLGISSVLWLLSVAVWLLGLDSKSLSSSEKMGITFFCLIIQFCLSWIIHQAANRIKEGGNSGLLFIADLPYLANLGIMTLIALIIATISICALGIAVVWGFSSMFSLVIGVG